MSKRSLRPLDRIVGGTVLTQDGLAPAEIALSGGTIASVGDICGNAAGRTIDARGMVVLPGIVDVHGDAFERQLQPRPGIGFPTALALVETERQLLASGVTTAFHGITLSWEPGLRSAATWRAVLDGLAARSWSCDMRVHLRWEAYNLDALEMAEADIAAGRVHMIGFNDHTPSILRALPDPAKARKYSERAQLSPQEFQSVAESAAARGAGIERGIIRIAAAARAAGVPMASHDDPSVAVRESFRARGATICEFPMAEEVGIAARGAGDAVVMGSPNVVRGGSHLGWASAARLAEAGICDVLCSDYYYPCLLAAPFILASRGTVDLAAAWRLVSANPARAAGLTDRGRIATGLRADLLVVSVADGMPSLHGVIANGRLVWTDAVIADRVG
jgi:alpha-D-ribose 1-methylphosphonate 5-triphosphate diphosphatase